MLQVWRCVMFYTFLTRIVETKSWICRASYLIISIERLLRSIPLTLLHSTPGRIVPLMHPSRPSLFFQIFGVRRGPNFGEGIDRAAHFSGLPKATDSSSRTAGPWDAALQHWNYESKGEDSGKMEEVMSEMLRYMRYKLSFCFVHLHSSYFLVHVGCLGCSEFTQWMVCMGCVGMYHAVAPVVEVFLRKARLTLVTNLLPPAEWIPSRVLMISDVIAEASCRRYEALEEVVLSDQVPEVSAQFSVAQYVPIFPRTSRISWDEGEGRWGFLR